MATKVNQKINSFLPLSQNYVGKFEEIYEVADDLLAEKGDSNKTEQNKNCLSLNLIHTLRHAVTGEYSHTTDFSCLEEDMLNELEGMKKFIEFDRINALFDDKLHLINNILISYGFFFKVYVIQKKFCFLNLGDQNMLKRKAELTSCVSNEFNDTCRHSARHEPR